MRKWMTALALVLVCMTVCAVGFALETGSCGATVTWTLEDDGTLTLSGSGATYDFSNYSYRNDYSPFTKRAGRITKINIDNGITILGSYLFYGCEYVNHIEIPDSVWKIGDCTFMKCYGIKDVQFSNNLQVIGMSAFASCTRLISISIPSGTKTINNYAFSGCIGLASVYLPEGLEMIGTFAFNECYSLTQITIPETVTTIPYGMMSDCSKLTKVICKGVRTIDDDIYWLSSAHHGAFAGCIKLQTVVFGENLQTIGKNAFCDCSSLTSLTIPESVSGISDQAFYNSGLTTIIGVENSYAETYAQSHGYVFASVNGITGLDNITLMPGKTIQLKPRQSYLTNPTFTYKSNNTRVATVSANGKVTAIKPGTATITVTSSYGQTKNINVTVKSVAIKLNKTNVSLRKNATFQIKAKQSGTSGAKYTYKSSNKKIATVDKNGKIKGVKKGTCKITVISSFGEKATVTVTVK